MLFCQTQKVAVCEFEPWSHTGEVPVGLLPPAAPAAASKYP
ncbi:MAG: hypothetical protein ACKOB9_03325 [Solirubrobacterales bacterium]